MTAVADAHNARFRETLRGLVEQKLVKADEIAAVLGWESSGPVWAFLQRDRNWNAGLFLALCHGLSRAPARGALRSLVGYPVVTPQTVDTSADIGRLALTAVKQGLELLDLAQSIEAEWRGSGGDRPRLVTTHAALVQQAIAVRDGLDTAAAILDARLNLHMTGRRPETPASDTKTSAGTTGATS